MIRTSSIFLVLLLASCAESEPSQQSNKWHPNGANAGNIAAMVANPRDLIRGHGDGRTGARQSADAVDRLWQERAKPLAKTTGGAPPAGGAAAPGGQN